MTTSAPQLLDIDRDHTCEEVPRRRPAPAPARTHTPSVTIRRVRVSITAVGAAFTAWCALDGETHVFPAQGASLEDHRDAAAECLSLVLHGTRGDRQGIVVLPTVAS
jgi:hypothetical protein